MRKFKKGRKNEKHAKQMKSDYYCELRHCQDALKKLILRERLSEHLLI
jgi:hypothetical protein